MSPASMYSLARLTTSWNSDSLMLRTTSIGACTAGRRGSAASGVRMRSTIRSILSQASS